MRLAIPSIGPGAGIARTSQVREASDGPRRCFHWIEPSRVLASLSSMNPLCIEPWSVDIRVLIWGFQDCHNNRPRCTVRNTRDQWQVPQVLPPSGSARRCRATGRSRSCSGVVVRDGLMAVHHWQMVQVTMVCKQGLDQVDLQPKEIKEYGHGPLAECIKTALATLGRRGATSTSYLLCSISRRLLGR